MTTNTFAGKPMTIFALSSAPGRAGVAVIRVSGDQAGVALLRMMGATSQEVAPHSSSLAGLLPRPRSAHLTPLYDPKTGDQLDEGLVLWFPAPNSFTGEDVAEFHVHGGSAVVEGLLASLSRQPGSRMASPGEFSRRAFENGKFDLTAAEGLADLIEAETSAQRRQAVGQMGGTLTRLYGGWRETLLTGLAHLEADIDFPDENLGDNIAAPVLADIRRILGEIKQHLDDARGGERLRDGFQVVILGPPNAGKSSLLNALAQRDVAIISKHAGTTRDIVECHLDLGGYPVTLVDTAGLRDTEDEVEAEGVRRALARADEADLVVHMIDAREWPPGEDSDSASTGIMVANKVDLTPGFSETEYKGSAVFPVSATIGTGIDDLIKALEARVAGSLGETSGSAAVTRLRYRENLENCVSALERAMGGREIDLVAEDLRAACWSIAVITGAVDVEDILDRVFRDFCIGK